MLLYQTFFLIKQDRKRHKCDTIKGNESLVEISISIFLNHILKTSKCFILMQTPLQLDIWLQSYDGFDNA